MYKYVKRIIPTNIKDHIKLILLRKKFPGRKIYSPLVSRNISLGIGVVLKRGVNIKSGVKIGNYSYVNNNSFIASGVIENFCSIAYNVQIGVAEHPTNYISTSPYIYDVGRSILGLDLWDEIYAPPIIGNDVWVGSNAIILQDVKIGDGAIVAAGAVVTKDVPAFTIVGGVPAKTIKKRFTDGEIKFLQDLKWWDMSCDELAKYKDLFAAKDKWAEKIK